MKKFLFALMFWCGLAYSQSPPPIIERQFFDDTYVHVPLQFGFPFYGRTFTNSWMHSNGVVSFLDPAVPVPNVGWNPAQGAYCCEGVPPSTTTPQFSYMIAPMWTDLYPVGQSRFRTQGDATFQRYHWENIAEISNMNNLNSFGLEIRPSGYIGAIYQSINIQNQNTWIGTIGDPTLGQWNQTYYGRGIPPGAVQNWSLNDTPASQCQINPLSSASCPGYTEAMCSTNPLFSTTCSGYQQAYFNQQCSINSLYNVNCPGYASAYLNYQCNINPLFSTTCVGYETAYFNQQCSLNSLYNSRCPGYAEAYRAQQCSINPLFSSSCQGYAEAYFNQQCSLNGLYDRTCPNYAEAYARKMLLERQGMASTVATAGVVAAQAPATTTTTTESTSPAAAATAVVSDPVVNQTVTATTTTASPAAAATATVQLAPVNPQPAVAQAPVETKPATQDKKPEAGPAPAQQAQGGDKPQPSARQQLAERRAEAAKRDAVERGNNLANEMGKAADMEAQKVVQNIVIAAMGYTPGFDAYNRVFVPDAVGYRPFTIYNNQSNVDNARLGRGLFGPTDRLHNAMVDQQYK